MKSLILISLFASLNAFANPAGTYYFSYNILENGSYAPEQLSVVSETLVTTITVHNGAIAIVLNPIKVQGNEITFFETLDENEVTIWNCNGKKITTYAGPFKQVLNYEVNSSGLLIKGEEFSIQLPKATPEQIARIQSLPLCVKE